MYTQTSSTRHTPGTCPPCLTQTQGDPFRCNLPAVACFRDFAAMSAVADSALMCPCCLLGFRSDSGSAYPTLLSCGHTLCCECASACQNMEQPTCAVCGGLDNGGTPNVSLALFADAARVRRAHADSAEGGHAPALSCEDCKLLMPDEVCSATFMCNTCSERPVCDAHVVGHTKRKVPHSVAPLGLSPPPDTSYCMQHPTIPVNRFCFTDSCVLCAECVLVGHTGHNVALLEACGDALRASISRLSTLCTAGSAEALKGLAHLQEARSGMVARKTASCVALKAAGEAAKAAIDAQVALTVAAADRELRQRLKQVDAQLDELSVSANQLACSAAVCEAAVATAESPLALAQACDSAVKVVKLARPYRGPCVSTIVEAVTNNEEFDVTVARFSHVRLGPSCTASVVLRDSSLSFTPTDENVVRVEVRDEHGALIEGLTAADAVAWFEDPVLAADGAADTSPAAAAMNGAGGLLEGEEGRVATLATKFEVASVEVEGTGALVVTYTAPAGGKQAMLNARIVGCEGVAGAPWLLQRRVLGCAAQGRFLRSITVASVSKYGMAVSPDEKWMVVVQCNSSNIAVYDVASGALVRVIGTPGGGTLQFSYPYRVCFTPSGSFIVVDYSNNRLQEVTVEGVHVRDIPVRGAVMVWTDGKVIVLGTNRGSGSAIDILDFATGAVMRSLGPAGDGMGQVSGGCEGLRVSPDGQYLVVCERANFRLSMFTIDGVFVRHIGKDVVGNGYKDVEFTAGQDVIVADHAKNRVCVFSIEDGSLLRSFGADGAAEAQTRSPTALAVRGSRLYVMEQSGPRVQIFE